MNLNDPQLYPGDLDPDEGVSCAAHDAHGCQECALEEGYALAAGCTGAHSTINCITAGFSAVEACEFCKPVYTEA